MLTPPVRPYLPGAIAWDGTQLVLLARDDSHRGHHSKISHHQWCNHQWRMQTFGIQAFAMFGTGKLAEHFLENFNDGPETLHDRYQHAFQLGAFGEDDHLYVMFVAEDKLMTMHVDGGVSARFMPPLQTRDREINPLQPRAAGTHGCALGREALTIEAFLAAGWSAEEAVMTTVATEDCYWQRSTLRLDMPYGHPEQIATKRVTQSEARWALIERLTGPSTTTTAVAEPATT